MFVLAGEQLGGAERNAIELAAHLVRTEDAQVSICALDNTEGRARQVAAAEGIPWTCLHMGWGTTRRAKVFALVRAAFSLRRLRPHILISGTNLPNVVCGLTWRFTGARTCVWTQCDVLGTKRINTALFRRALLGVPVVMTTAFHARDWLIEEFGADPRRIRVVYSKVELPDARQSGAAWRSELGIAPSAFAACMVGHLHGGKDHPTLLRAWRIVVDRLQEEGREAVLLLAGRPAGSQDALKGIAFDLDLRSSVRFLGDVDDLSGLFEACDMAVFCSRSECLGRGATEAMYAGLAVAGTNIPGIREAVGEAGWPVLATPGDVEGHADTILRLAGDPDARARLGKINAELIRERQCAKATSGAWAALLEHALRRRPDLADGRDRHAP